MKRMIALACTFLAALALGADPLSRGVLHVFDEVNDNAAPYLGYFREAYANRWFLEKLYGQLTGLLDGKTELDAVSMPTRDLDETAKKAAVQAQVDKLR